MQMEVCTYEWMAGRTHHGWVYTYEWMNGWIHYEGCTIRMVGEFNIQEVPLRRERASCFCFCSGFDQTVSNIALHCLYKTLRCLVSYKINELK